MSMFLQHSYVAILIPKVVELGDWHLGRRFELENRALMIGVIGSIEETTYCCIRAQQEVCESENGQSLDTRSVATFLDLQAPEQRGAHVYLQVAPSLPSPTSASPQ